MPEGIELVIVADRGFGRASFFRALRHAGIRFIVRIRRDVHLIDERGSGPVHNRAIQRGQTRDLPDALYGDDARLPVRCVLTFGERHGSKRPKVPWYLVTDLAPEELPAQLVVAAYTRRMRIEQNFRDHKSMRGPAACDNVRRMVPDYRAVNLANWNSRVPHHERGYGLERFLADPAYLSRTVRFDLPRLGSVAGLEGVHLQCHVGDDTLSLARLGARMTGLDFSAPALEVARRLARDTGARIDYVESDVYETVEALGEGRFDLVFTGIGALCWIPDIRRWAEVVARLLRPGGRLFVREGHPMLLSLSLPRPDGLVVIDYPYFETPAGTAFVETKTYVEHEGELASPDCIAFNHGLGQIIGALMQAGLTFTAFEEHDSAPWDFLAGATVADAQGEYRLKDRPERLAATYTLQAVKPRAQ